MGNSIYDRADSPKTRCGPTRCSSKLSVMSLLAHPAAGHLIGVTMSSNETLADG